MNNVNRNPVARVTVWLYITLHNLPSYFTLKNNESGLICRFLKSKHHGLHENMMPQLINSKCRQAYLSEQVRLERFLSSRGPNLLTEIVPKGNFFFKPLRKVVSKDLFLPHSLKPTIASLIILGWKTSICLCL